MPRTSSALLLLTLLATGCGTDRPRAQVTVTPTTAAPTRATASPSPTRPSPFPHAANGSNIGACADGRCEVLVTHPIQVPLHCGCGVVSFAVTRIRPNAVYFDAVGSGGLVATGVKQPPGARPSSINHLRWEVVAIKGHRAVIKLSRA